MSLRKKLKKVGKKVKKAAKSVGKTLPKVAAYAPAALGAFGGPLAAGLGTAGSTGLSAVLGPKKDRKKNIKRAAKIGAISTAASGLHSLVTGGDTLFESAKKLLGYGDTGTPGFEPEGQEPLPETSKTDGDGFFGKLGTFMKDTVLGQKPTTQETESESESELLDVLRRNTGTGGGGGGGDTEVAAAGTNWLLVGALVLGGGGILWMATRKRKAG